MIKQDIKILYICSKINPVQLMFTIVCQVFFPFSLQCLKTVSKKSSFFMKNSNLKIRRSLPIDEHLLQTQINYK